jgi:hypothetical protein
MTQDAGVRLPAAAVCRLLSTPERLRVVAALVLGASTIAEVGATTGLSARETAQALTKLTGAGLVTADGSVYRLETGVFAAAGAEPDEDQGGPERDLAEFGTGDPETAAVLRRFISGGRLLGIPSGRPKRRIVLDHLAMAFEIGRRYQEKEVNAILRAFCEHDGPFRGDAGGIRPDHVTLRRYLIDEDLLSRQDGVYWRSGGTVEIG